MSSSRGMHILRGAVSPLGVELWSVEGRVKHFTELYNAGMRREIHSLLLVLKFHGRRWLGKIVCKCSSGK